LLGGVTIIPPLVPGRLGFVADGTEMMAPMLAFVGDEGLLIMPNASPLAEVPAIIMDTKKLTKIIL